MTFCRGPADAEIRHRNGSLFRIWSTGNVGDTNRIKIFIDGDEKPAIDETFNSFHDHRPLRDRPQVGSGAGDNYLAWWSYMPIGFRKSCKVVRVGNFRPFYSITYHTYTDTSGVRPWRADEDLSAMENMWNHPDVDPKPVAGNIVRKVNTTLEPGKHADILNESGEGYVASLKISNYLMRKDFRIRMYWDNETVPSVDAPVKWFFGSVDNGGDVKALGIGTTANNGYCYFPMPYWQNARIELVNLSDTIASDVDVELQINKQSYDRVSAAYFHARANEVDKPGKNYTCLSTKGRGHVVGMAKRMPKGGHACEADEIYYLDNRKFPDVYGTGEEDYSNCAWWKNTYNSYPTHGHIGNDCYYRIHFPDLLVYEEGIDMMFESWQNYYIASVVWYYESDNVALHKTDSLDVGNVDSEKQHAYSVNGGTWWGTTAGIYPGRRIRQDTLRDNGRRFTGNSEFSVNISKNNRGVRLRLRTDNVNFRKAVVKVDGTVVIERLWYLSKNNY